MAVMDLLLTAMGLLLTACVWPQVSYLHEHPHLHSHLHPHLHLHLHPVPPHGAGSMVVTTMTESDD